ncbi:hypothetical protein F4553_007500 [Allocatelliglobosispora scoriae]|uniref:FHA domain-containing protein n=1 Tax=Allocatelliglobosispora scoriae TaxID=643052 RepID=A0A841C2F1_9ACTN|nr:hypothetical protein [Allocatelliglobosispora scoriae]MBB5874066.1 hypothetical protein [Allocatelliglobosispora scoriae]
MALVRCDPLDDLVTAMWPCVAQGDLPTLLIALMGRLANLPDFALVQIHDRRAVVLARGAMQVQVLVGDQLVQTIAAGAVTTWHEDSFERADRVRIVGPVSGAAPALPLVGGVVAASQLDHPIVWGATAALVAAQPSAAQPSAAQPSAASAGWPGQLSAAEAPAVQPAPQPLWPVVAPPVEPQRPPAPAQAAQAAQSAPVARPLSATPPPPLAPPVPATPSVPVGSAPPAASLTTGTWDDRVDVEFSSPGQAADPSGLTADPAVAGWQPELRGILPDRPALADWPSATPSPPVAPPVAPVPALHVPLLPDELRRSATRGGDTDMAIRVPVKGRSFAAVRCPKLHLNPPATPSCRICHLPLDPDDEPIGVAQPSVGHLRRFDTGERWELNRPVIILGRDPGSGSSLERLVVKLSGVSSRVAGLHAEIRLDGWRVEVVDLSGQSTQIINPDGRTLRLEPNSPMRLLEKGRIVLAGEVTLTFEVANDNA